MNSSDFNTITKLIESFCNAEMKEAHFEIYKTAILHRNYFSMKEAVNLAFSNGTLDEYSKKRVIPSPEVFNQLYHNIANRKNKPEPEIPPNSKSALLFITITKMAFNARETAKRLEPGIWAEKIYSEWQNVNLSFDVLIESILATAEECRRQEVREYVAEIAELVESLYKNRAEVPEVPQMPTVVSGNGKKEPLF